MSARASPEGHELGRYALPKGWRWATIPELTGARGVFIDGDWVESKDQDPRGDVRLIQLADVGDGVYRDKSDRFMTKAKADELRCTFLQKGDVLIARMPDPLGRACIFPGDDKPSVTVVDVAIVRSGNGEFDHCWLACFVNTHPIRAAISGLQVGSTRKRISRGNLATIPLPVPPLLEQRRIVAEIEKQFTRLDAGATALKRVQANLKRYRAAVLKAACEGKLVPTEAEVTAKNAKSTKTKPRAHSASAALSAGQSPEFESGSQLLQRILAERRRLWEETNPKSKIRNRKYQEPVAPDSSNLPQLPEGWAWASVAQVGESTTGFTPPKGDSALFGGGIPFFKPTDLDAGYHVREYRDSLSAAGAEHGRLLLERAILVTCIGATIGKVGLARVQCATNQQINALTIPADLLLPEYVYGFFASPFGQSQIKENASTTTLPILNKSKFEALALPLPPLAEQTRIVAEVERRLSVVDELEAVVTANLQRSARLRQSILQKAFGGGA